MWDGRTKRQRQLRITHDPDHFGGVYQQLQIGHLHARPYNAKAKPIERFFRTFEEQFNVFEKTYCGRSTDTKPERLADYLDRGLAPDFDDYVIRALAWIDDAYANQPSGAQGVDGRTPMEVYTANLGTRRMTSAEQLDCCLMLTKALKVGRNGIQWQHRRYGQGDPAIRHLLGQEVLLRIDPADVTEAQVWDATGKQRLCVVRRNDLRAISTVSDDQERDAIRKVAAHNRQLKNVRKRGVRIIDSPAEILIDDAIQQARRAAAERPPEPPTYGGVKLVQTGIDPASIADRPPLKRAVGAETAVPVREVSSTLAAFAEDDA
jgi:putative transposase